MFSYVPFSSFIVLAGNTVADPSVEDLTILWSALSSIEPVSVTSPSGKKLYNTCKTFYKFTENVVSRHMQATSTAAISNQDRLASSSADVTAHSQFQILSSTSATEQRQTMHQSFQFPPDDISGSGLQQVMTPRAWDAVMNDFDADVDPIAMASFIEPYLFFDGEIS